MPKKLAPSNNQQSITKLFADRARGRPAADNVFLGEADGPAGDTTGVVPSNELGTAPGSEAAGAEEFGGGLDGEGGVSAAAYSPHTRTAMSKETFDILRSQQFQIEQQLRDGDSTASASSASTTSSTTTSLSSTGPQTGAATQPSEPAKSRMTREALAGGLAYHKWYNGRRQKKMAALLPDVAVTFSPREIATWKGHFENWFKAENQLRSDKHWPTASLLKDTALSFKSHTFRGTQTRDETVVLLPHCLCCATSFQTKKLQDLQQHFAGANHLSLQHQASLSGPVAVPGVAAQPITQGMSKTQKIQDIVRLQVASFGADHPTLSMGINADTLNLAERVYRPVSALISLVEVELRQANVTNLVPTFCKLKHMFKAIESTSIDADAVKETYNELGDFRREAMLFDMRNSFTGISFAGDESVAKTNRAQELYMASYVDTSFDYRVEFYSLFNVSRKGETKGLYLFDQFETQTRKDGLWDNADHTCMDGSANVQIETGPKKSFGARFVAAKLAGSCSKCNAEWCICHKLNLAFSDLVAFVNKAWPLFLKTLRQSNAYLNGSGQRHAALQDKITESRLSLVALSDACEHAERHVVGLRGADSAEEVAEKEQLKVDLDAQKISRDEYSEQLRALGKRRATKGLFTVRWYSLCDSSTSLVHIAPFLMNVLSDVVQAAPAQRATQLAREEEGHGDDDAADDDAADDVDNVWGESKKKKWKLGEKEGVLLMNLKGHMFLFSFFADFGRPYKRCLGQMQLVNEPLADTAYDLLLEMAQTIFNTGLSFVEPRQLLAFNAAPKPTNADIDASLALVPVHMLSNIVAQSVADPTAPRTWTSRGEVIPEASVAALLSAPIELIAATLISKLSELIGRASPVQIQPSAAHTVAVEEERTVAVEEEQDAALTELSRTRPSNKPKGKYCYCGLRQKSPMLQCSNEELSCVGKEWYHPECIPEGSERAAAEHHMDLEDDAATWYCPDCRSDMDARAAVEATRRAAEETQIAEEIKATERRLEQVREALRRTDSGAQFWDQDFRIKVRRNSELCVRDRRTVDWSGFEHTKKYLAKSDAPKDHADFLLSCLLLFLNRVNIRFAGQWATLEALTVFNPSPEKTKRNKNLGGVYVTRLLEKYPLPTKQQVLYSNEAVLNAMHVFFSLREDETDFLFTVNEPKTRYYGHLFSSRVDLAPYAMFALHCLRLLLTTVCVESRFTLMNQRQGKGNSNLGDDCLRSAFVLRDAARSQDIDWSTLYEELNAFRRKERLAGRKRKTTVPRGIYQATRLKRLGQDCWQGDQPARFQSNQPLAKRVRRAFLRGERVAKRAAKINPEGAPTVLTSTQPSEDAVGGGVDEHVLVAASDDDEMLVDESGDDDAIDSEESGSGVD
jgi:hypothetical protein